VAVRPVVGGGDVDGLTGRRIREVDGGRLPASRRLAVLEDHEADLEWLALDGGFGRLRIGDDLGPAAGEHGNGQGQQ
jgi:hypothetical protein